MLISEFRDYCETLARFASVRENAPEPTDRVLVQCLGGTLKFVAGSETQTVIVDAGPSPDDFRAVVSARLLLSAGKALKGKGEVNVEKGPDGAILRTTTGGEVRLPNVATSIPKYLRPATPEAWGVTAPGFLPTAVRRIAAVSDGRVVFAVTDMDVSIRAVDRHMYAEFPIDGLDDAEELVVPVAFVESLRGFDAKASVILSEKSLTVTAGPYTAVTAALDEAPFPRMQSPLTNTKVLVDRKALIEMVKGTAPHDEFNRVALTVSGASIAASPWGKGDTGMSLPAKVDGVGGSIGVTADYLLKLLNVITVAKVGLAWQAGESGVIRVFGENDPWLQLLAPVALSTPTLRDSGSRPTTSSGSSSSGMPSGRR